MARPTPAEDAVRKYLAAVADPSSLRDESALESLRAKIAESTDQVERLKLRQQLSNAEAPALDQYENAFVTHAKAWADENGIGVKAFAAEGVDASVLRRAGFAVAGGGRGRGARRGPRPGSKRTTTAEVKGAMPRGGFTVKVLQDLSGASPAVVRKAITEEIDAGRLEAKGTDPDHRGPGRQPTLYLKVK